MKEKETKALHGMPVHPSHRRCGVSPLLMSPGIHAAELLGLEAFIDASPVGHRLYEKSGFRVVLTYTNDLVDPRTQARVCTGNLFGHVEAERCSMGKRRGEKPLVIYVKDG